MSKINARSPFFASISTPTKPSPAFTCTIANGTGLSISQEGVITLPQFEQGTLDSFSSSDSGFADSKYATVTVDTTRTLVFRIAIPSGFSNTSDGFLDCTLTATQPKRVTSGTTPSCSGGPTVNGSVPTQTLASGGNTVTVNLASYFNQGTSSIAGFTINNYHTNFMQASVVSSTLTITSASLGGSKVLYVSAFDNDVNTCRPTQAITVTISVSSAFTCTTAGLKGGSIAQDGSITDPDLVGTITARKLTSGGGTITNAGANSASTGVSKTLFFDITVPSGYTNTGATIECSKTFTQAGTGLLPLTCDDLTLTEQGVYTDGSIKFGKTNIGTLTDFSPKSFAAVDVDTNRTLTLTINAPSGYSNSGSDITCTKVVTQPANIPVCGSQTYYLALDFVATVESDFCQSGYRLNANRAVLSTASDITDAYGHTVCSAAGTPFAGSSNFYRVDTFQNYTNISTSSGPFYIWQISNSGVIEDVWFWDCASGGDGQGFQT